MENEAVPKSIYTYDELVELLHFAQNAIQMICAIEMCSWLDKDLFIYSHSLK